MDPKIIKLGKKDDIASVVKKIKDLREREVVFELERGSELLSSSYNLRLMKKTGEVLGKKVQVMTSDPIGKLLAKKADMLFGNTEEEVEKAKPRVKRSDVQSRFSDIVGPKRILPINTAKVLNEKVASIIPKFKIRTSNFSKKFLLALSFIVVIVFGLAVILPQASITVYARSEPVSRDVEIQVDRVADEAGFDSFKIPGQLVIREISHTKAFATTGLSLSGTKASGKVYIYNSTNNTLRLNTATTTLTANGKNYFFGKDVGGIKPGANPTGPIDIVAEKPGEGYNLSNTTRLEIKNSALGNQNVYAVSSTEVVGGVATSTKVLSQEDFDRAVAEMATEVVKNVETDLAKEQSIDIRLLSSGSNVEVLAKTANKEINQSAEEFDLTVIARVKSLAFKESDVRSLVVEQINSVLSDDKYLIENGEQIVNAQFKSLDLEIGKGLLVVRFDSKVAYKIDDTGWGKILAGKSAIEIKELLLVRPEIDRVDVNFSPFFVNKAPRFNGKIYIKTVLAK